MEIGLKISKEGVPVQTATEKELSYGEDFTTLRIAKKLYNDTTEVKTLAHGMGFVPVIIPSTRDVRVTETNVILPAGARCIVFANKATGGTGDLIPGDFGVLITKAGTSVQNARVEDLDFDLRHEHLQIQDVLTIVATLPEITFTMPPFYQGPVTETKVHNMGYVPIIDPCGESTFSSDGNINDSSRAVPRESGLEVYYANIGADSTNVSLTVRREVEQIGTYPEVECTATIIVFRNRFDEEFDFTI